MPAGTRVSTRTRQSGESRSDSRKALWPLRSFLLGDRRCDRIPVKLRVTPYQHLREQCTGRIDQDIAKSGLAHRHKRLVPLVEPGIADGDEQGNEGPLGPPAVPLTPNPMKHGNREDAEFGDVCCLSNSKMQQAQRVEAGGRE